MQRYGKYKQLKQIHIINTYFFQKYEKIVSLFNLAIINHILFTLSIDLH